jgi:hypothetical protein
MNRYGEEPFFFSVADEFLTRALDGLLDEFAGLLEGGVFAGVENLSMRSLEGDGANFLSHADSPLDEKFFKRRVDGDGDRSSRVFGKAAIHRETPKKRERN